MKTSTYIAELQALIEEHGDLELDTTNFHGDRIEAQMPTIGYRKILAGRERKPMFWTSYCDKPEQKGEMVFRM